MRTETFTYEECKRLDVDFNTPVTSPLHRSNRFPIEWRAEARKGRSAYTVVSTPMTPAS